MVPHAPESPPAPEGHVLLDSFQQDKLSLIGHMASSIAHELSNPLATIVATTQAILSVWPRQGMAAAPLAGSRAAWSPPAEYMGHGVPLRQLREDLELILEEARRAGDIVHGLLASARHDPPEWRICSVADVVRRTVALSRHHLKLHNIALQSPFFDPQEGYPIWSRIRGDSNQLQQVLLNLIINAQQAISTYRGYGAVRLTVAPDGPDRVVVTVEDDGPGIPESQRETIFQPFYTTKPAGQGTGLGLSISAEIVQAHGGEIQVETHAQGGAVFRIGLPSLAATDRAQGTAPALPQPTPLSAFPAAEIPEAPTAQGRILLVDDEAGIRRSVGRYLRLHGYSVTEAPNAEAALSSLKNGQYDVVISDLRMPGLSGEEFFALLRQEFPDMVDRVVFTSGDMLSGETQRFIAQSGRPALQKPYELTELVQVVTGLCPSPGGAARRASA